MKNTNLLGLLGLVITLFLGCTDETKDKLPANPTLSLGKPEVILENETENTAKVEILSNVGWMALKSGNAGWVSVSPDKGDASSDAVAVTFTAKANPDIKERSALIRIVHTLGNREDSVIVRQPGKIAEPLRFQDSLAMVALYDATKGYNWKGKWNLKVPMTEWPGIKLDIKNGQLRVTEIELTDNNLVGEKFPEEMKNLTELRKLVITYATLACEIPEFFGELKNLNFLALNYNGHTGGIPKALYGLNKLYTLHLMGNALSGEVDGDIGNLVDLEDIDLAYNQFSGPIPAGIGKCTKLEGFRITRNKFTGLPVELAQCTKLKVVAVEANEIEQEIGEMFDNYSQLEHLFLQNNKFSGKLPELTKCSKLYDFRFSSNAGIKSDLPKSWSKNLPELMVLVGNNCNLSGGIPEEYAQLKEFTDLSLDGNKLSGTIPAYLRTKRFLSLSGNEFTEAAPEFIDNNMVVELFLAGNKLSGDWSALFNSVKVTKLDLSDMPDMTGTLPVDEGEDGNMCGIVKEINLSGTQIGGRLPAILFHKDIQSVKLADCQFTGVLPNQIGNCLSLTTLILKGNKLSGAVSDHIKDNPGWRSWKAEENICPQRTGGLTNCN